MKPSGGTGIMGKLSAKKVVVAAIVVVGLFVAVVSWWSLKQPPRERQNSPSEVSLRLAWIPGATFAGDYVALQQRDWSKRNLDVKIESGGFQFDAIKLVASGRDTFGVTSGPQLLQARANGVPIVAIAAVIPDSPIGWVARENSGIKSAEDFRGKKIGAEFGTLTEITFVALLNKLNMPLSSVQRIPVQFDPAPFVSGAIDVLPVYVIDQPIDLEAQGIKLNIIDPRAAGVAFSYGNVYFTTEKELNEHPEVVRAFLAGAQEGWLDAFKDRDNAVKSIELAAPDLDPIILRKKLDATFAFILSSNPHYAGQLFPLEAVKFQHNVQLLSTDGSFPPTFNVVGSFDNSFLPK